MNEKTIIYVAGHRGMVGSAIVRNLKTLGYKNIVTRTHDELDLTNQAQVQDFLEAEKPDQVYLCAGKVGGIHANNTLPAEFIYENLMIESNVVHNAWRFGVKKLLYLGSSCIYPKHTEQPIKEEMLLSGQLEATNAPYAVAKIAGIKLCESYNRQYGNSHGIDYRSVMPTNLYGPGDNYHPENSHVIPALIRRFHEAKINQSREVVIWGSGSPRREFLYVDDMAKASIHVMNIEATKYKVHADDMFNHINIGCGHDITIRELACKVAEVVAYDGSIAFDSTKPDGTPGKLMDCSRIESLGWKSSVSLADGLDRTYADFVKNNTLLRMN